MVSYYYAHGLLWLWVVAMLDFWISIGFGWSSGAGQTVWPSSVVPSQRTDDGLTTDRQILSIFKQSVWLSSAVRAEYEKSFPPKRAGEFLNGGKSRTKSNACGMCTMIGTYVPFVLGIGGGRRAAAACRQRFSNNYS